VSFIKILSKATCDPENCSERTLEKIKKGKKRKVGKEILMQLAEQTLELASIFKEERSNFIFFSLLRGSLENYKPILLVLVLV